MWRISSHIIFNVNEINFVVWEVKDKKLNIAKAKVNAN